MTMTKRMFLWLAGMFCGTVLAALPSEITVTVKPSQDVYVEGERMRVVVDIANASPDVVDCRNEKSPDSLVLELYRASDKYQFDKTSNKPFTARSRNWNGPFAARAAIWGRRYSCSPARDRSSRRFWPITSLSRSPRATSRGPC